MDDSHNLISLINFQSKYELQVKPLTFFGIISAVKLLQRQIPETHLKYESLFNKYIHFADKRLKIKLKVKAVKIDAKRFRSVRSSSE